MGDRAVAGHTKRGLMLALALLASPGPVLASGECPPAGYDKAALQALKAAEFALADADAMPVLAEALLPCLASRDPEVRVLVLEQVFRFLYAGGAQLRQQPGGPGAVIRVFSRQHFFHLGQDLFAPGLQPVKALAAHVDGRAQQGLDLPPGVAQVDGGGS